MTTAAALPGSLKARQQRNRPNGTRPPVPPGSVRARFQGEIESIDDLRAAIRVTLLDVLNQVARDVAEGFLRGKDAVVALGILSDKFTYLERIASAESDTWSTSPQLYDAIKARRQQVEAELQRRQLEGSAVQEGEFTALPLPEVVEDGDPE